MNDANVNLHRSIEAAKSLRLALARMLAPEGGELSGDDVEALQDTFDGETTLDAEIRAAVLQIEEDEIIITGCKARETELRSRRARIEKRVETTRGLIEQAMTIVSWKKHEMDIGTVVLGKAAPRVEIDDESAIPTQFWKPSDPTLDRAGLRNVLKERHRALLAAQSIKDDGDRAAALLRVDDEFPPIDGCRLATDSASLTIKRQ